METVKESFTKQYDKQDVKTTEQCQISTDKENGAGPSHGRSFNPYRSRQEENKYFEEPIDLTFSPKNEPENVIVTNRHHSSPKPNSGPFRVQINQIFQPIDDPLRQFLPKKRMRKRKFPYPEGSKIGEVAVNVQNYASTLIKNFNVQSSETKQVDEVLKAAKSLFSKRTRTLYHWMHPNAPKQQIKAAVATSWESLGSQEKEFYISQVLGRFGFPQCNLMINPQLGGIKELPPLPDLTEFNNAPTSELQNAISSITGENPFISVLPQFERIFHSSRIPMKRKKRLGRPPGSKNKKYMVKEEMGGNAIMQDFQDDPELSKELQQFAINLNMT